MNDIPSNPVTSVSGATTSGGGTASEQTYQASRAKVVDLPPELRTIDQNISLGARLVGANADGSVVLRTARGDLTLNIPINLPPGTPLQLQMQPGNPPIVTVLVMQPEGTANPTRIGMPLPQTMLQSTATAVVQNALGQLPEIQLNSTLRALVMNNAATNTSATVSANMAALPNAASLGALLQKPEALAAMLSQLAEKNGLGQGTQQAQLLGQMGAPGKVPQQVGQLSLSGKLLETMQQTINMLQQQPGGGKGLAIDQNQLLQILQGGGLARSGSAAGGTAMPSLAGLMGQQLIPGTELNVKVLQVLQPGQAASQTAAGNAQIITGQITSQVVNGQPVLQTPQGNVLLQANPKLAPGTTVVLEVVQDAARMQAGGPDGAQKLNAAMPKLEQAMTLLSQADPQTFQTVLNTMPRLNGQFPVAALYFMHALRTGDVRAWLGEKTTTALRRAGSEGAGLLEELGREFGKVGDKAKSAKAGEWRQVTIPYLAEYGMDTLRLAVRDHHQPSDQSDSPQGALSADDSRVTRFVLDISFSELGPMQVDGLMRPGTEHKKQLDIVLRTQELLPSEMRRDLRDIYANSLGAYGMSGGLSFQAGYQNWIKLAEERGGRAAAKA